MQRPTFLRTHSAVTAFVVPLAVLFGTMGQTAQAADVTFAVPPASRCVTAVTIADHNASLANAKRAAAAVPITDSSPAALKQAYDHYLQGISIAWAALEAPFCGYTTAKYVKVGTPQHSYDKTIDHLKTAFNAAVAAYRHGQVIPSLPALPAVANASGPVAVDPKPVTINGAPATTTKVSTKLASTKTTSTSIVLDPKTFTSLSFGMRGDGVSYIQGLLAKDPSIYPEKYITGYFGNATERAVIRFQKQEGLLTNGWSGGTVGPKTFAKLQMLFGNK